MANPVRGFTRRLYTNALHESVTAKTLHAIEAFFPLAGASVKNQIGGIENFNFQIARAFGRYYNKGFGVVRIG